MRSQLEKRFSVSNGSRKYKLCKEVYELKQCETSVSDYYTKMRYLWVELEAMDTLPTVTELNPKILTLLKVLDRQKEEHRLFQFLNGLDEIYGSL